MYPKSLVLLINSGLGFRVHQAPFCGLVLIINDDLGLGFGIQKAPFFDLMLRKSSRIVKATCGSDFAMECYELRTGSIVVPFWDYRIGS